MQAANVEKSQPARKKGLTIRTIQTLVQAAEPGMWAHERGLCLVVAKSRSAHWALRYSTKSGTRRLMTMEAYEPIDAAKLKSLEWQAAEYRKQIKAGGDPLAERNAAVSKTAVTIRRTTETFENVARDYIEQRKEGWKNRKHKQQWENTLATYAYPIIGKLAPHAISTTDVLNVLQQQHVRKGQVGTLWTNARETSARLRSRIETVIAAAKAKGLSDQKMREDWNNHHNPARWEDNLEHWLNGKQTRKHFAAMSWQDAPAFVKELAPKSDFSAKALMLTILCAVRTNETINATWDEIDIENCTWTIPPIRMKTGVEHRVPLSSFAVDILRSLHRIEGNPHVFPGAKRNKPLSDMAMLEMLRGMHDGITVHGFRSAFRDWTSETTLHPDTVAEMALAHTVRDKTERAYRRGDALDRRRNLMQQWCDYLTVDATTYKERWAKFIA